MYIVELCFECYRDTSLGEAERAIVNYLDMLRYQGQILGREFPTSMHEGYFVSRVVCPEQDSLHPDNQSEQVKLAEQQLNQAGLLAPKLHLQGADLLSEQLVGPLNGDQQEICQMLEENSRRLQTLIERLLDFNRLSQQEVFTLSEVPLAPLLSDLSEEYRLALESKQISVHLPPEPISLRAEPYRLRLILDNLFSNAVSYGARGGQIWIRAGAGVRKPIPLA